MENGKIFCFVGLARLMVAFLSNEKMILSPSEKKKKLDSFFFFDTIFLRSLSKKSFLLF